MRVPTRTALLEELDSLGYRARMTRVATLGRDARGDPALAELMRELVAGDAHEATLAVEMARGARDETVVRCALTHPSRMVRGRVASLAGATLRDEVLEQVLPELDPQTRRRVIKSVALARRGALAARLLPHIRARYGDGEGVLLLTALDAEDIRRLLPELAHVVTAWATLVHLHPDVVLDFLRTRLAQLPQNARPALISTWRLPLAELLHLRAEETLALLREHDTPHDLPLLVRQAIPRLSRKFPEQIVQLVTRPSARDQLFYTIAYPSLARALVRHLSTGQLQLVAGALAKHQWSFVLLLRKVAPSRRAALYTHAFANAPPAALDDNLFSLLPHALRDAEAVRLMERPEAREQRSLRITLLGWRTIEHSREPLKEAAFASKAEDRAQALAMLVRSTGLSRRGLTETLTYVCPRLKNEQRPVLKPVLNELARVPVSLFKTKHIELLEPLVTAEVQRDVMDARKSPLYSLAAALIRAHVSDHRSPLLQFALMTLEQFERRHYAGAPELHDLPHGSEHHLVAAVLPRIRAIEDEEERNRFILFVCDMLGYERAGNVDMLQAVLGSVINSDSWSRSDHVIHIRFWLKSRRTRDARVHGLLAREPSAITLDEVYEHFQQYWPEKLEPYLDGRPVEGRFHTEGKSWVPLLWYGSPKLGFHRWLPRQQERYRDLLLRLTDELVRDDPRWPRKQVLRVLLRLRMVVTEKHLRSFLDCQEGAMAETSLGALAWLDRPESALPVLLEHLDGDRAHVAIQTVARLMERVSPGLRTATLSALLARDGLKVTVHKEVVRMLGTARDGHSLALLRQQWDSPRLHRDVRIAAGHAARRLLDTEESAWEMVEAMVRSPDPYVAGSLLKQRPEALPLRLRPRYAALVLRLVEHPDTDVRREALGALTRWAEVCGEQVARTSAARIQELSIATGWREAVQALIAVTRNGFAFEHVVACAAALISAPVPEAHDAGPERDLPALQRLRHLVGELLSLPRPELQRLRPHLAGLARVLATEASLWPLSARLRTEPLYWRDVGGATDVLLGLSAEAGEEPFFTSALESTVASSMEAASFESPPEALLEVAARVEAGAPLVALALVREAGKRLNWREDAARHLRALRRHPSVSIRAAARALTTVAE
ncbi:hypothetical protein BO221_13670 [Archangium sp. Cb G35]|uniref:hypothetical protein n=1 Tax=Archangium sp. Cb G35 TaxID=1920190 RepID=UPI0009365D27|nr:hypothetical protein [Archangium sp. Cb G35]OJT24226.1 hypothetical protein BO221_13670 [Archangium sp. Cb G35]